MTGLATRITQIPLPIRLGVLASGIVGMGLALALLLTSPAQAATASFLAALFLLVALAVNPLGGFLIWLLSHPFTMLTVNIKLGESVPDLSLARICIGFLVVLILAQAAIGKRKLHGVTKVEIAFLLFVVGFGASMVNVLTPANMLQTLFDQWVAPLIAYWIVKNLVADRRTLDRALKILLVIGAYSSAYMLYELNTGNVLFLSNKPVFQFYGETSLRIVRGLYGTTLIFGLLFNWLLPIAVHYFLKAPTLAKKALYGAVVGLMLAGDLFTYKRTTWIALVVSFLLMQWYYPRLRRFFIVLLVVVAGVMAFAWDRVSQSEVYTERAANEGDWNTANGRTDGWTLAWEMWKEKPLFGQGYNKFDEVTGLPGEENDYLHILVASGLAGFVPYMAFYIFVFAGSLQVYRQIGTNKELFVDREMMIVFWGLYSTYFVTAMSSSGNDGHTMANFVFFALMGAMVGSQMPRLVQSPPHARGLLRWLITAGSNPQNAPLT